MHQARPRIHHCRVRWSHDREVPCVPGRLRSRLSHYETATVTAHADAGPGHSHGPGDRAVAGPGERHGRRHGARIRCGNAGTRWLQRMPGRRRHSRALPCGLHTCHCSSHARRAQDDCVGLPASGPAGCHFRVRMVVPTGSFPSESRHYRLTTVRPVGLHPHGLPWRICSPLQKGRS
jgi:hypothetical protein